MSDRSRDWMAQAQDDLEAALVLRDGGKHGQACFTAQRYPNGHASGASFRYYGQRQSQQAIEYAREIVEYALSQMAGAR